MKNQFRLAIIAFAFTLSACSSLTKQAEERFDKGEFLAAAQLYQQALAKDPSDVDAAEGLKLTRQQLIQDRLIQVRLLRLSDNSQQALDQLNEILSDEAAWSLSPTGAAFATQTEEVQESFKWFRGQVTANLQAGQALKAKIFSMKYAAIFDSGDLATKFAQLEKSIAERGNADCRTMTGIVLGHYAADFVHRYCMVWGATSPEAKISGVNSVSTYGAIHLKGAIANLPAEVIAGLADSLLAGLKSSPYYTPGAKPLEVQVDGRFDSSYSETPYVEVHAYSVQVPYQVQVTVPYQVDVPTAYESFEPVTHDQPVWNSATQKLETKQVTEMKSVTRYHDVSETRYRDEWETRYRAEERTLPYPATRFNLRYQLSASGGFNLDKVHYVLPLNDELNLSDSFHDTARPEIGLRAKRKQAPTMMEWLGGSFAGARSQLSDKIAATWDSKYCQPSSQPMDRAQTEVVMKCLRGTHRSHEFVENWFQARFGLTYAEVDKAVGILR